MARVPLHFCWFYWGRWGQWARGEIKETMMKDEGTTEAIVGRFLVQARQCGVCGKLQIRKVKI